MLVLENLRARLGDFELTADFSLPRGEFAAIIGPSGAGKSMLLSLIAGFLAPSQGRILWNGRDIAKLDPGARPVSMVFQDHNLFPHLTAFQNVALGISPSLRLDQDDEKRVAAALSRVGLSDMGDRRPSALSGGQQSRAALARVLVRRKPLILLDEPFAALGPALRGDMLDLVREVAAEIDATVLMISHEPRDARRVAAQTVFVDEGRVLPPVATASLFNDPPPGLAAYLGAPGGS